MTQALPLSRYDQRQRKILRIGAVYDAGFGVPLLFVPAVLTTAMSLPFPNPGDIWLRLDGIFLIILGLIYWIMSEDPARYLGILGVILIGKIGSIVFYLYYVLALHETKTFILFAALDGVMFGLHYWALGPGGIGRIRDAVRPAPVAR